MKEIYFDNASTALPVFNYICSDYANPSTTHKLGIKADLTITNARKEILKIVGCDKSDVVFTSGGTESNNLAIIGYGHFNKKKDVCFHALPWAHPSVLEPMKHLSNVNNCSVKAFDINRILFNNEYNFISLPQICHETGNTYDIGKIAQAVKETNPDTIIHIDGVQGFCKEKLPLENIDLYSFSSHKIHGPAGVGGLVIKKGIRLSPVLFGGKQEHGLRAGTENTNGIAHFTKAALYLHENMENYKTKTKLVKTELMNITSELSGVYINTSSNSSPYILNMSFEGVKGEVLMNMLSEKGIYVSTGAACKIGSKEASLIKMGFSKAIADSSIRLSFSHHNTIEEAQYARYVIIECVTVLRKINRKKTAKEASFGHEKSPSR